MLESGRVISVWGPSARDTLQSQQQQQHQQAQYPERAVEGDACGEGASAASIVAILAQGCA